jgi:hypothetical protein
MADAWRRCAFPVAIPIWLADAIAARTINDLGGK